MRDYKINRKGEHVCNCPAYPFPHRLDSKACKELYDSGSEFSYEDSAKENGTWIRVDVDDWKFMPYDTRY